MIIDSILQARHELHDEESSGATLSFSSPRRVEVEEALAALLKYSKLTQTYGLRAKPCRDTK